MARRRWRSTAHQPGNVPSERKAATAPTTVSALTHDAAPLPVGDLRRVGLIVLGLALVLAGTNWYMRTGSHSTDIANRLGLLLNTNAN